MSSPIRHVIYLHGFASSPASSKSERFRQELTKRGVGFSCPDLNLPDFETLTTTRMLGQIERLVTSIGEGPIALVGSSLGGFVAIHAAARLAAGGLVDRIILLAPAVDFGGNRLEQLGDQRIEDWQRSGRLEVFHYAENRRRFVRFDLYEDSAQYDAFAAACVVPTLVFQGRFDDAVVPAHVETWARARPQVDLCLLNDGHQLSESVDVIWNQSEAFLGLRQVRSLS